MSRTVSPGRGRRYGLARACRTWLAARSAVHRHRTPPREVPPRRPGPPGPMPDAALVDAVRGMLAARIFHGEIFADQGEAAANPESLLETKNPQKYRKASDFKPSIIDALVSMGRDVKKL